MICKLTGKEGKPAQAHIIPESFYLIDRNSKEPMRLATNTYGVYSKRSRKGIYDNTIVTIDGERTFQEWDDYAFKLLVEQFDTTIPLEKGDKVVGYKYEKYDYKKLKLFFMSVLWRAGASSQIFFSDINLGPHLDNLRQAILADDPGNSEFYSVNLAIFDDVDYSTIMQPFPVRFDGIKYYRFYLGNMVMFIKVDRQGSPSMFKKLQLDSKKNLYFIKMSYLNSKELKVAKDIFTKMDR